MSKYVLKRVALLIPSLIIVCIIVFSLIRMIPGGAVDQIVSKLTAAGISVDRSAVEKSLGLDKPALQQFFIWVGDLLHGNLGDSFFQGRTVWDIISKQLPISLELGLLTLVLTNLISIPLGVLSAARQDSFMDQTVRIVAIILMAVPVFWMATMVLIYPARWWGYAPPIKYVGFFADPISNLKMFLVPAFLGALTQSGMQLRMVRTSVLEVMRQDYVRTAHSKGLKESTVLFGHAFRNSLIPVVTLVGGSIAGLVGGSVILENLFNIPGIGAQMVAGLTNRDYPVVQGCVLVFSVFVMLVNLLVDITYKWIDPRVSLD
jgi:peptide/nickel transport system permease protein